MQAGPAILILDTSVLVNFLAIARTELFLRLGLPVLITDHVASEIAEHYPEQREVLEAALSAGHVTEIELTEIAELEEFAKLSSSKPSKRKTLGDGECSAIAIAAHRGFKLGIDDKAAIKLVRALHPTLVIQQTFELVVQLIRGGVLSVEEADRIKHEWATTHSFALPAFNSFSELI